MEHIGQLSPDGRWRWDGVRWLPIVDSVSKRPGWLQTKLRSEPSARTLSAVAAIALLGDQAMRSGTLGLAASLALVAGAAVLLFATRPVPVQARVLAVLSLPFAVAPALRASPWLTWPDVIAATGLLLTAASLASGGSLLGLSFAGAGRRVLHGITHLILGLGYAAVPAIRVRRRTRAIAPLLRGLGVAVPIAAVVIALLAAADPIFASFFRLQVDAGQIAADLMFLLLAAFGAAGLLRIAAAAPMPDSSTTRKPLGFQEALVVLGVLDAVFAAFAVAQAIGAAGAGADTIRQAGMTYAEYARSGFFQLLWAAGITLSVLVALSRVAVGAARGAFKAMALLAVALTLLVVYVAFRRLGLYEDAYGFTMLRLYSHAAALWIALVFLLLALELAGAWRGHERLAGLSGLAALALLLALNVANPEALVLRLDVARTAAQKLDVGYLRSLSSDAVPAMLEAGGALHGAACAGAHTYTPGWQAWVLAEQQAASARAASCR